MQRRKIKIPLTEVIKNCDWSTSMDFPHTHLHHSDHWNINGSVRMFYSSNFVLEGIFFSFSSFFHFFLFLPTYIEVVRLDKPRFLRLFFFSAIANKLRFEEHPVPNAEKVISSLDRNIPICKMKIKNLEINPPDPVLKLIWKKRKWEKIKKRI